MSHRERDNDSDDRSSLRPHRSRSERDPNRPHKSSRGSRLKVDPETGEIRSVHRHRKDRDRGLDETASMADTIPELARTASAPGASSRTSLPYPSFSKAHSKEAVNSREDVSTLPKRRSTVYTPEATDVGSAEEARRSMEEPIRRSKSRKDERPPSPPETEFSEQRREASRRTSRIRDDLEGEFRSSSRNSWFGGTSKVSVKSKNSSKASTAVKSPTKPRPEKIRTLGDEQSRMEQEMDAGSGVDSNATSVARKVDPKSRPPVLDTDSSPASLQDSSPKTPTQTPQFPPPDIKPTPSPYVDYDRSEISEVSAADFGSPMPPPPPPPPDVPVSIPRIDYLMQNGGLLRPASKNLLSVTPTTVPQPGTGRSTAPTPTEVARIFSPYFGLLDQYETVISKNGSLAVATGYRSVARRLLDRLENVFARDLSSEGCTCVMCQSPESVEGSRGLGWGEVLEWVSGRRELPAWPAFDFATLGGKTVEDSVGLGISKGEGARPNSPVKLDPDISEEFREHFLAQSKKTKAAVDRWLSSCPQATTAPPQEVDDETLSFTILTHLDPKDRPYYNALISGSTTLQPVSRSTTPYRKPRPEFLVKTGLSLQRLYRLQTAPRDPESVVYLVKNPQVHNLLATLSGIVPSEWEILTSGRFDGFLWSGADTDLPSRVGSPAISRGPTPANSQRRPMSPAMRQLNGGSRTTTPFSPGSVPSRGPTPASYVGGGSGPPQRQPVSNDEEAELAALAEIEREIYQGMEALEDAFENLHRKAETVRKALRARSAGLSLAIQARRSTYPEVSGTPGFPPGSMGPGYERPYSGWGNASEMSESDWDYDEVSELGPDDSASNISSSRHRRPKRRTERRTPALVEEEEEDEA
ncbi:hypothetical protein F5884DRAFT_684089 [Xylogone sp. PMI_703]|nr:hypothetical protein F5884DRAFT_684089 [Xylogone sp. PMI_703]